MSKQILKEKINWFIDNKHLMGSNDRKDYLDNLIDNYGEFIPYSKYMLERDSLIEMISKEIIKRQKNS